MNAIEELLDDVIKPTSTTVDSDWSGVVTDSNARQERRTALGRVGVVGVVTVFLLIQAALSRPFDFDVITTPPAGGSLPGVEDPVIFPTSTDVFALAGEAPLGPLLGSWLVALLPLLSAWVMCCLLYTSPSPRDQRGSRMPSSA